MASELQREIGQRMRWAAKKAGITQKEIAARMAGYIAKQSAISRWWSAETAPDADCVQRYCEIVGASPAYIWTGKQELTMENVAEASVQCLVDAFRGKPLRQAFNDMIANDGASDGFTLPPELARELDITDAYAHQRLARDLSDWQSLSDEEFGKRLRQRLDAGI